MITRNKPQIGEGKIKSFDLEAGGATRRRKMVDEEAQLEEEGNFFKEF